MGIGFDLTRWCKHAARVIVVIGLCWSIGIVAIIGQENTPPGVTIHVVQRGETLYRIAVSYGLTIDELARLNGLLNPNSLQVGQRLLVPINGAEIPETHIVQPGESLRAIADLYGVALDDLATWNDISDSDSIYAGQVLILAISNEEIVAPLLTATPAPTDAVTPEITPTSSPLPVDSQDDGSYANVIHTVVRGETLFLIARSYGVTVNAILTANPVGDPDTIYAGQQLVIPGVEAPQLSASLPAPLTSLNISPLVLVEGRTVQLQARTNASATVTGTFLDRPLQIAAEENNTLLTALIGVPLGTESGIYPLELSVTGGDGIPAVLIVNLQVGVGSYGFERIRLMEGLDELLNTATEAAELSLLNNTMTRFSTEHYLDGPMGLPAAARMTSPFGSTRSYNGGAFERVHTGADFAGVAGTPILAPASGRVVLADDLNIRGTATVIDHGWGVYTGYWHQSARYVDLGDFVETGQVIGAIGSTGRVTGAHLHWELWVNGVPVDPMQWVSTDFS